MPFCACCLSLVVFVVCCPSRFACWLFVVCCVLICVQSFCLLAVCCVCRCSLRVVRPFVLLCVVCCLLLRVSRLFVHSLSVVCCRVFDVY